MEQNAVLIPAVQVFGLGIIRVATQQDPAEIGHAKVGDEQVILAHRSVVAGPAAGQAEQLIRPGRGIPFTTCNLLVQQLLIAK
ncbi:MAG: hypothetical protein R3C19_13070 [Planctomycetaceae bacterium]